MSLASDYPFVSVQQRGILHEDLPKFYCYWRHKFAIKALLWNPQYCIYLTATCISATHTERIVVFPLQKWLRERPTMLRYAYISYLFHVSFKTNSAEQSSS